jgi:predicted nucleotidyltransferase
MFKKEIKSLKHLKRLLTEAIGDNLLMLVAFGSRIKGDFRWDSDLDILVVLKKTSLRAEKVIRKIVYSEGERLGVPYSVIIRDSAEFGKEKSFRTPFYSNIINEGAILYERVSEQK